MSTPFVSIIIPTYNRRRWIGECLDAIKAQTYPNVETLVIDDRSSDDTVQWLRAEPQYSFAQIHVQPQNAGASEARNVGIRKSRGQLITFIDSDDVLARDHVEKAVEIFQHYPNVGLFCCDSTIIGPAGELLYDGRTWHEIQSELKRYPVKSGLRSLVDIFLFSNCFPGFTLRREVLDRVGYFDQSIFPMDDYDLALRVGGGGYGVYYSHEPLALRRDHIGQASGSANSVRTCLEQIRTLRLALERNPTLRSMGPRIRRRMAEVKLELAVSRIYAGERTKGLGMLIEAVATDPARLIDVARLGSRRLQRLVASA